MNRQEMYRDPAFMLEDVLSEDELETLEEWADGAEYVPDKELAERLESTSPESRAFIRKKMIEILGDDIAELARSADPQTPLDAIKSLTWAIVSGEWNGVENPDRLKFCASCFGRFYDHSRPRNAKYCSDVCRKSKHRKRTRTHRTKRERHYLEGEYSHWDSDSEMEAHYGNYETPYDPNKVAYIGQYGRIIR